MNDAVSVFNRRTNRRKFLKHGVLAAGAATVGAGMLTGGLSAFGRDHEAEDGRAPITKGDIAILQFRPFRHFSGLRSQVQTSTVE